MRHKPKKSPRASRASLLRELKETRAQRDMLLQVIQAEMARLQPDGDEPDEAAKSGTAS